VGEFNSRYWVARSRPGRLIPVDSLQLPLRKNMGGYRSSMYRRDKYLLLRSTELRSPSEESSHYTNWATAPEETYR